MPASLDMPHSPTPSSSSSSTTINLDVEKSLDKYADSASKLSVDEKLEVQDDAKEQQVVLKTVAAPTEKIVLPPQQGTEWSRWFFRKYYEYHFVMRSKAKTSTDEFLTTYRKTFAVIFFVNLAVLIWLCADPQGGARVPDLNSIAVAVSANIMVSILFRQENWVNLVYEVACCVPHWFPLAIRRRLAKVFHCKYS